LSRHAGGDSLDGLVATWHRTCHSVVASPIPGRDAVGYQPWASCSLPRASITKQYNLILAKAGT